MQVSVLNLDNKEVGKVSLNPGVFGNEFREDIISRIIKWQRDKARSGCHQAKERNEVSGSTRKIYRQKGTGQARHGSIKAPIFVGGGIVFGPLVRDHGYKLNKKTRKLGLKIALSKKLADQSLIVIESAKCDKIETSELNNKFKSFNAKTALIIDFEFDNNFKLSAQNIKGLDILPVAGLNVLDIIKHEKVFITSEAIKKIEERLL